MRRGDGEELSVRSSGGMVQVRIGCGGEGENARPVV